MNVPAPSTTGSPTTPKTRDEDSLVSANERNGRRERQIPNARESRPLLAMPSGGRRVTLLGACSVAVSGERIAESVSFADGVGRVVLCDRDPAIRDSRGVRYSRPPSRSISASLESFSSDNAPASSFKSDSFRLTSHEQLMRSGRASATRTTPEGSPSSRPTGSSIATPEMSVSAAGTT